MTVGHDPAHGVHVQFDDDGIDAELTQDSRQRLADRSVADADRVAKQSTARQLATVSRCTPSSRAIRRHDQPRSPGILDSDLSTCWLFVATIAPM
jgi:hypothetical protein